MSFWENTTYIEMGNTKRVITTMTALFQAEGMERVAEPSRLQYEIDGAMQYGDSFENNIWALAVFPGATNWTIIKSAPLELLGERVPGESRMRLVRLCEQLGALGFQLNIYDSAPFLIETDGAGNCLLSGLLLGSKHEHHPLDFHGEQLLESRLEIKFDLLPLQYLIDRRYLDQSKTTEDFAHDVSTTLGGANASYCDNATSVTTLIRRHPLT